MSCNGMASSFFPPNFLLQMQTPHDDDSHHHHPHPRHPSASLSPLLPTSSCPNPQDYHAVAALLGKRSSMSFSGMDGGGACEEMNGEDDLSDDCSQAGEKKRRLNMEQVKTLEKNFELGNKLEPERKMQLARALGLQPRQIAIWFQNRRARWKTKQLEKDYDVLKRQFEAVKSENDALQAHNKKLQAEIMALRGGGGCTREISEPINLNKDTEGSCSNRSDNSSDVNLDISRAPAAIDSPLNHPHHNHQSTRHSFFHPIRPPVPPPPQPPGVPNQLLHHPKIEHGSGGGNVVQDESFCSMFCTLDDQPAFWTAPWTEQQSFH